MIAVGPIFPEQATFKAHVPLRDQMAALERAVADELRQSGYLVLGSHPRVGTPDPSVLHQVQEILTPKFAAGRVART